MQEVNWTALIIFVLLFAFITWLGFAAAQWRKGDLDLLHEWGLGGRRFGTVITWFLIGGDLYTAYTFIAVPALAFGAGAIAFFAVPYTIVVFPLIFIFMLASLPAGLVIYWTWSNILSVAQQYVMMRRQGVEVHLFENLKPPAAIRRMLGGAKPPPAPGE